MKKTAVLSALLLTHMLSANAEEGTDLTIDEWIAMSDKERRRIAREWSPYDTDSNDQLLRGIVDEFRNRHPRLQFRGLGNVHGSLELVVERPFIFDKRLIPISFLGLQVRSTLSESIPDEFKLLSDYVWAPENYANFVDTQAGKIRRALGNPDMDREEMLYALIGMPFEEWVEQCRMLGPGHTSL